VAALAKGLAVVEAFDAARPRATLSEVAHLTGLTRAAARRYLLTLVDLGYAESDGKHFWLTPRILRLGYAYLSSAPLPRLAQPVLEQVGEQTQEVASLALLDGHEILFVAHSANRRILSATAGLGTRFPAYCTAMGRVLLGALPEARLAGYLSEVRPVRLTPHTCTGLTELRREIARARDDGYAVSDGELEEGLRSIAVPVSNSRGAAELAMSVSLQAGRMSVAAMRERLLPPLRAAAAALARML
jgi:IclR family pca regulon transcriptional regulator